MKPQTFVNYLVGKQKSIMNGWISGAAFEGHVQVLLDEIARDHLSANVARYKTGDDEIVLGQQSGKQGMPDPVEQVGYAEWERMREIKYDNSRKISDMRIINNRFVEDKDDEELWTLKSTLYWIELKVESPGTEGYKDFGGMTPVNALNYDVGKLALQKQTDIAHANAGDLERRRYWYVMLAFSPERRAFLKSLTGAKWTIGQDYTHPRGVMGVFLMEV